MFVLPEKNSEYLKGKIFVGLVEDNKDKKRKGRVKVRVQGVFNDIELDHIPWASPYKNLDGKSFCVPAIGKIVNVIFPHGNLYEPHYIYSENYNINLQNKLTDLQEKDYMNFVALLFDDRTQIYSDDKNLRLDYYYNQMSIHNDGINLHLKDNDQELHLGHDFASQSAVLGDHWMIWFDEFMNILSVPTTLIGNFGAPILRPQLDQIILKYQALRETFLSQHVKIVDNGSCLDKGEQRENAATKDDFTKINNEQILKSPTITPEVKNDITQNREEEQQKLNDSKPNTEDIIPDEDVGKPDSDEEVITPTIVVDSEKINLTDKEKYNLEKTQNIDSRKNTPKTENIEPINLDDPYDDFWAGWQGREPTANVESTSQTPGYGTYYSQGAQDNTVSTGTNSTSNEKTDRTGQKVKTTKFGIIRNGEIDLKLLTPVEGFTIKGSKQTIYLESNAAKAFDALNKAVIKDFKQGSGNPLNITGSKSHYRTLSQQHQLYNENPKRAAKPGRSNHGWGLACDITEMEGAKIDWNTPLYKWLSTNAAKYNIYNTLGPGKKPEEPWHWEFTGTASWDT